MPVVIRRAEGKFSIMHCLEGADVETEVEKWKQTSAPGDYISHFVVPDDVLPPDASPENIRKLIEASLA